VNTNVEREWWKELDLNYVGANNFASFFSSEGNIHTYPAKAVPEMVFSLLKKLKEEYSINKVLDPFTGSGTVALESKYLGLDFYGSDLNPLSILLARTKALTVHNTAHIEVNLLEFVEEMIDSYSPNLLVELVHFDNIEYWFKSKNIKELSYIKGEINRFLKKIINEKNRETYALILLTGLSSTIRESSLTRNNEFKLYRKSPSDIEKFSLDSLMVFKDKILNLLSMLVEVNKISKNKSVTNIYHGNAKDLSVFYDKGIDAILTSPPYGDSQSTVAYGQFSRLSLQWLKDLLLEYLDIHTSAENVDEDLLGGKKSLNNVSLKNILRRSGNFRELFRLMRINCKLELCNQRRLLEDLTILQNSIKSGSFVSSHLEENKELYDLIRERIRLEKFRSYNKSLVTNKAKVKFLAIEATNIFMNDLKLNNYNDDTLNELFEKLQFVSQTIKRKIKAIPRRIVSVIHFFKELYIVVEETDKVLSNGGVQAWIVGHRTILGLLTVDMAEILNDWFVSLGYSKVTTLHRQYSFKRLPHHINSTVTRKNEIKTMMEEHIIVVKKEKNF
jgi:site-specific DNA-adenine methylase